jgi:hypothetical protein
MARPKLGHTETERMQLKITAGEVEAIDDWRFANRIPSRSEAVRRLCQIGLQTSDATPELRKHSTLAVAEMILFLGMISKICRQYPDDKVSVELQLAIERHGKPSLQSSAQAMTDAGELHNHVYQLADPRDLEESLDVVAKNVLRKDELDAQTSAFVKETIEELR